MNAVFLQMRQDSLTSLKKNRPPASTERRVDNFTISGYTGNRKKGALPVDGYALRLLDQNDRTFRHGAVILRM